MGEKLKRFKKPTLTPTPKPSAKSKRRSLSEQIAFNLPSSATDSLEKIQKLSNKRKVTVAAAKILFLLPKIEKDRDLTSENLPASVVKNRKGLTTIKVKTLLASVPPIDLKQFPKVFPQYKDQYVSNVEGQVLSPEDLPPLVIRRFLPNAKKDTQRLMAKLRTYLSQLDQAMVSSYPNYKSRINDPKISIEDYLNLIREHVETA